LVIIYPHNQRFLLRRAHDILVMKTCHALAQRGHQVYLLMGKTPGTEEEILGYYGLSPHRHLHLVHLPIFRLDGWLRLSWHGVFNFFCRRAIRRLQQKVGAEVVYLTEMKLARALLKRKRDVDLPVVYEVHGLYAPGYVNPAPFEAEVFAACDGLITTTESLQRVVEEIYDVLPSCFRVPLATVIASSGGCFSPPENEAPWRLGYIGQLYPLQGVDILVRALTHLPERVHLDIIGGKPEHIEELRLLAVDEKVDCRVTFHGFVAPGEVAEMAKGIDIFVAPCRAEKKMPFVAHTKIYEYLAFGRPVVAADLPSIQEEIEDGVNGCLFRPNDSAALAEATMMIIEDPNKAVAMGKKAFEKALQYTWERRAEGLELCFEAVLSDVTVE